MQQFTVDLFKGGFIIRNTIHFTEPPRGNPLIETESNTDFQTLDFTEEEKI